MTTIETIHPISEGHSLADGSRETIFSAMAVLAWLETVLERRRSRKALLEMSDDQLKDIGLSRADVHNETHKPFWR